MEEEEKRRRRRDKDRLSRMRKKIGDTEKLLTSSSHLFNLDLDLE